MRGWEWVVYRGVEYTLQKMGGIRQRTGDTNNYDNGWKKIQTFSIISVKANGLLKRPLKSLCVLSDCYDVCNPRGLHAVNFTCWPCWIHACFPLMCTAVTTTAGIVICHIYIYIYTYMTLCEERDSCLLVATLHTIQIKLLYRDFLIKNPLKYFVEMFFF